MPTLTLKRIRITSPLLPKPSEAPKPKTETATALQIPQNDNLTALVYHDRAALVYRDTAARARAAKINEKFPSSPSHSTPAQSMTSIADTSDGTAGSMNSNERHAHADRNRKSSSELVTKRRLCSAEAEAEGSTNVDVAVSQHGRTCWRHEEKVIKRCGNERRVHRRHEQQAKQQWSSERCVGLCIKPGKKRKACSSDGCTNNIVKVGVCVRSGAHVKRGVRKDAQIKLVREERVLCMGHGRMFIPKRCSRVGFTTATVLGMGHGRMFIPKRCSPVGFTNKLAEKLNARSKMCEVLAASSQVMGYVEPLQSVNEVMVRSHEYKKESASSAVTVVNSNKRNTQTKFDRKRKASADEDEELPTKKADVNIYRNRKICSAEGCTNRAVQGGVCIRHGAQRKLCSREECTNLAVQGGVCMRHGAKVKLCSSEGCTNQVRRGGVCIRHGAQRKLCSREECTNVAIQGGVCKKHGAKVKRCSWEGCTNYSVQGGVCMRHGAKVQLCSREGCTNQAKNGGFCIRHGAKPKRCKIKVKDYV